MALMWPQCSWLVPSLSIGLCWLSLERVPGMEELGDTGATTTWPPKREIQAPVTTKLRIRFLSDSASSSSFLFLVPSCARQQRPTGPHFKAKLGQGQTHPASIINSMVRGLLG